MSEEATKDDLTGDAIYVKLRNHLDTLPIGMPATKSGVEIRLLKHLFTPEEALVATRLNIIPQEPEDIYRFFKRRGWSLEKLKETLKQMRFKGLLNGGSKDGTYFYSSAFLAIGIFEYQLNRLDKEMMELLEQYINEGFREEMLENPVPQLRPIPNQASVRTITMEQPIENLKPITSYEEVDNLLEKASNTVSVAECVCRKGKEVMGNPCSHPKEVCLQFGGAAYNYIELGLARQITKDEARKIIKEAQEAGCVLQASNTQKLFCLCCCCGCSCEVLSNAKKLEKPAQFFLTQYYSAVDPDLCTACHTCESVCPMDAFVFGDSGIAEVNRDRCIGCGVCVPKCPTEAIHLVRKPTPEYIPPVNMIDMYREIARKRAELQKLKSQN